MPEMLGATMALKMKGLKQAALITDGRFSGATSGPCVGHICPEASDGGPIALVEDGDLVEIDIPNRKLMLHVDDETLARRRAAWTPYEREVPEQVVGGAHHGRSPVTGRPSRSERRASSGCGSARKSR